MNSHMHPTPTCTKHAHTGDEWEDAYRERLAEVDEEEFPEEEEEEEEEDEGDAKERMRGSLVEKFEEQTEAISTVQVSPSLIRCNAELSLRAGLICDM